jgi:hypothetical protein
MARSGHAWYSSVHIRHGVKYQVNRRASDQPHGRGAGLGAAKQLCCHSKMTKTKAPPLVLFSRIYFPGNLSFYDGEYRPN